MNKNLNLQQLVQLAMLIAIQIVMKAIGLGSVPVGPLNMSFLTIPIAVGAILIGPAAGAILGGVFGLVSFWDAVSGASVMTGTFFQLNPVSTFVLCVVTRVLMGLCTGLLFKALKKIGKYSSWKFLVGSVAAPVLNTVFFMGYIVLAFYNTEYIQSLVAAKGASNAFMFVILLVGVQGLIEVIACGVVGTIVCKALSTVILRTSQVAA